MNHDFDEAANLFETELPGWSYSFILIVNRLHTLPPFGKGVGVSVISPKGNRLYEKDAVSALEAAKKIVHRAKQAGVE